MSDDISTYDSTSTGSNASLDHAAAQDLPLVYQTGMSEADALQYRHPDYEANVAKWAKYVDCYRAREIYRFIHKHPREHQDVYEMRVKRGYYFNYVAAIVDLYVSYLYEAGITRTAGESLSGELEEFYKDADRCGTSYHLFMQVAATFAICTGHAAILVDMPETPEGGIVSEAQRKELNHRPYLTLVQAHQIVDWELDEFGKFEWVKIQVERPQDRSWNKAVNARTEHYLIWTKTTWERWRLDYEQAGDQETQRAQATREAQGDHALGEVPLVVLKNDRDLDHKWFGESAVRDVVDINLAILNWCSFADEEIANRCLNILTMQRSDTDAPLEISHYNVIEYAEGAEPPSYLTPGDTPLKLIWEAIDQGRNEIYRLSKLSGSTGLLGVREATSGIAYAFEFNETNQSLAKKANFAEQCETEVHRLVAKWLNKTFDGSINYPREFGVDDFLVELQILTEARSNFTSETAIKELEKRVAAKMFAKDRQSLREKIAQEIEEAEAKPIGLLESFGQLPPGMNSKTPSLDSMRNEMGMEDVEDDDTDSTVES